MSYYVYHIRKKDCKDLSEGYIGITSNYKSRWIYHKHHLRNNTHSNPHLQNAWLLYQDDIEFIVIHECNTQEEMIEYEFKYRPSPNIGWNCKSGGNKYAILSNETKEKIRSYNLGRQHSEATRKKQSEAKKGKPGTRTGSTLTEAQKIHLRDINLGKKQSTSTCKKKSSSMAAYTTPKLWVHITGLYFYGCPFEFRYAYPNHNLNTGALAAVYNNKTAQHKGWFLLDDI